MNLQTAMAEERTRLDGEIKTLEAEKTTLDDKINSLRKELKAIDAYERAKSGAPVKAPGSTRTVKQSDVLSKLAELGQAVKAELVDAFDVRGDVAGDRSLSNALNNLKKAGKITQDDDKVYKAL